MKLLIIILLFLPFFLTAQISKEYKGKYGTEHLNLIPDPPDYGDLNYWIAHPEKEDMADLVPGKGEIAEYQETAEVDVFFIYPTIYTKKQKKTNPWFADVNDEKLNKKIANSTIKYQSTVFNASAKVYSPLYRQSHIAVYYSDLGLKVDALQYSYQDVKRAFIYYLENFNHGRPIIIASHSQGTNHATSLLREFFEHKPLKKQLVAAYLVGMPMRKGTFDSIPICEDETQTNCWMCWNTFKRGYYPPQHDFWFDDALSINPLSWTTDSTYVSWGENRGGLMKNYKKIRQGLTDAQNNDGMVWSAKPKFFGNFLFNKKRYHIVDYNLFYMNIRENVELRVEQFFRN